MASHPVDLANARAGDEVTLPNGKVVIADGKGGGRVKRKRKVVSNGATAAQKQQQEKAAAAAQAAAEAQAAASQPARNEGTVARGVRAAAEQGSNVQELIRLGRGRPR